MIIAIAFLCLAFAVFAVSFATERSDTHGISAFAIVLGLLTLPLAFFWHLL